MDYIRYNAVKHGNVAYPSDWLYSTFQRCVEDGFYSSDWGGSGVDGIEVEYD